MAKHVKKHQPQATAFADELAIHADLNILLDAYLAVALLMLKKDRFVVPVGMKLSLMDKPVYITLQPATHTNVIAMDDYLKAYRSLLKKESDRDGKAVLLAYDTRLHNDTYTDAITIELEHDKGTRVLLLLPYRFSGLFKKLHTGDIRRIPPDTDPIMRPRRSKQ